MSRLDLAKMAVEDIVRGLKKRVSEHNVSLQQNPVRQKSLRNIGLGFCPNDQFLLLSTGRQHTQQPATAACGAGGRLLVGYGDLNDQSFDSLADHAGSQQGNADSFQRELKQLRASDWEPGKMKGPGQSKKPIPFPDDGGGAMGLNVALSAGLQLLSRYRLLYRSTENYGMGRLPSTAGLSTGGGPAVHSLQPACLIVLTDGVCLRTPPSEGGGSLQLQYGNMPLREFYREPFRWDQRIFCLGVGGREGITSNQFLHPHLRALCEVTGGAHMMLRSSASLGQSTDVLLKLIAPPKPRDLPIPDPLRLQAVHVPTVGANGTFVAGGPVCCFQALESDLDTGQAPPKHRALILFVPQERSSAQPSQGNVDPQDVFTPPTWCIPESYFPSRKLDALPPRPSQPHLLFSRYPARLGSKSFDPNAVMKALNRLDQLVIAIKRATSGAVGNTQPVKLLNRDVYICEWVSQDGKPAKGPSSTHGAEYFPVIVSGAGRPVLSEEGNLFNIGILHVPSSTSTLASSLTSGARLSTLTLLPPEPHILLPLLIRAADAEHRAVKKVMASESKDAASKGGSSTGLLQKQQSAARAVHLDEHWRNEFRAYLYRLPPYYQNCLKRSLRNVLPTSAHSLLNSDGTEGALASQCFSKTCLQKIRNAEQITRETNERLERQEEELRWRGMHTFEQLVKQEQPQQQPNKRWQNEQSAEASKGSPSSIGYGKYDPRSTTDSFLAALRNMPPPWRAGTAQKQKERKRDNNSSNGTSRDTTSTNAASSATASVSAGTSTNTINDGNGKHKNTVEVLGDLPSSCLMAFYESRRRWVFGGSGVSTRGLFVDGVHNDGSNVQRCGAQRKPYDESLLSFSKVGVSQFNSTTTTKMGDYRERLLWSRAPVVGYGSNDSVGVSVTTAANGSPTWSVDDDAMPMTFFDARTGEFVDSVQARVRSRLMVNFGNPYKDRRADSLIPERFLSQCPSAKKGIQDDEENSPMTPPGSPPHDNFSTTEGEGEAVFAGKPLGKKTPRKSNSWGDDQEVKQLMPQAKKQKMDPSVANDAVPTMDKPKDEKGPVVPHKQQPPPPPPPKGDKRPDDRPSGPSKTAPPPPPKSSPGTTPPPPPKGGQAKHPGRNPPPGRPRPPRPGMPPQQKGNPPPPGPPTGSGPGLSRSKPPPPPRQTSHGKAGTTKQGNPPVPGGGGGSSSSSSGAAAAAGVKRKPNPSASAPIDMQSPDKKPNVDLPAGWMCVWSKSQRRWYFFDTRTNKSVWQWPP